MLAAVGLLVSVHNAAFQVQHPVQTPRARGPGLRRRASHGLSLRKQAARSLGRNQQVRVARKALLPTLLQGARTLLGLGALGIGSLVTLILVRQYGIVVKYRHRLPPIDLGLPVLGQSMTILKYGWSGGGTSYLRQLQAKHGPAFVFNLLFVNRVAVDYPLYEKYMQDLERAGRLRPLFSNSMQKLLGQHSILTLPAGKGGSEHAKIRQKIGPALGLKQLAILAPRVEALCRVALEALAEETQRTGQSSLLPKTNRLTQDVAAASLLGRFSDPSLPHLAKLSRCIEVIIEGLFTLPREKLLGKVTPFGEAVEAKKKACELVDDLLRQARADNAASGDVLARLAQDSEEGEALSAEEVQDTIITIAFAGKVTAAAALPVAVVELARRPEWVQKLSEDAPDFTSAAIEESRPALQFVREAMRLKPPAAAFYRACDEWIELGEHGAVPPGVPVAVCMDYPGAGLNGDPDEFKPSRWTEEYTRKHFPYFGGATPHACIGRSLANLEMQTFLHMLCRDYSFEILSEETVVDRAFTQVKFKDGLPMKVWRKSTAVAPAA